MSSDKEPPKVTRRSSLHEIIASVEPTGRSAQALALTLAAASTSATLQEDQRRRSVAALDVEAKVFRRLSVAFAEQQAEHAANTAVLDARMKELDKDLAQYELEKRQKHTMAVSIQSWSRTYINSMRFRLMQYYGRLRRSWTPEKAFAFLCANRRVCAASRRDSSNIGGGGGTLSIAQLML